MVPDKDIANVVKNIMDYLKARLLNGADIDKLANEFDIGPKILRGMRVGFIREDRYDKLTLEQIIERWQVNRDLAYNAAMIDKDVEGSALLTRNGKTFQKIYDLVKNNDPIGERLVAAAKDYGKEIPPPAATIVVVDRPDDGCVSCRYFYKKSNNPEPVWGECYYNPGVVVNKKKPDGSHNIFTERPFLSEKAVKIGCSKRTTI